MSISICWERQLSPADTRASLAAPAEGPHPDRHSTHGTHAKINQIAQKHGNGDNAHHVADRGVGLSHATGTNKAHESLGDKIKKVL